jgi:hypothetical protein
VAFQYRFKEGFVSELHLSINASDVNDGEAYEMWSQVQYTNRPDGWFYDCVAIPEDYMNSESVQLTFGAMLTGMTASTSSSNPLVAVTNVTVSQDACPSQGNN